MEAVLREIDRRIKRLQAEVEIAEQSLEMVRNRKYPKARDYSTVYLLLMLLWLVIGFMLLFALSKRAPMAALVPTEFYAVFLVSLSVPLLYGLLRRGTGEEPGAELVERQRLAKLIIREFYTPLMRAIEGNDVNALEAIAEKLLNDSSLGNAIESLNEGNPKLIAYSLLLYTKYRPELRGEVEETIERLANRPLRALLSTLVGGQGYNPESVPENGGEVEVRDSHEGRHELPLEGAGQGGDNEQNEGGNPRRD